MFKVSTKRLATLALSAGLIAPAAIVFAADPGNTGAANQGTSAAAAEKDSARSADHHFIMKAAEGNLAEVKLGELAQQNGTTQDVKDFGKRMVDDHSKALTEIKQLAQAKGVDVPSDLKGEEKTHYDKLAKLNGKEFDQAYIRHMIKDHTQDIAEFKKEAQDGKDPDVKAWASRTLPTLEEHERIIERVAQANGVDVEGARTAGEKQPPEKGNTGADTQRPGEKPQK